MPIDAWVLPTTPALLTDGLRDLGTIERGEVVDLVVTDRIKTMVSHLWLLSVSYSHDVSPALPGRVILKWPLADLPPPDYGAQEPLFYRVFGRHLGSPPMIRALAASRGEGRQWVVIEDLRSSHTHPSWPARPTDEEIRSAVSVLAALHSRCWGPHDFEGSGLALPTEEGLRAMVAGITGHLPAFLDHLGDTLVDADRAVLDEVFSSPLLPWLRIADRRALTVAHGDAHTWNFLYPRSGQGDTYIIDWQTWHVDVGARDLAYMMALHWDSEVRRRLERPLLEHYHRLLVAGGVGDYSLDELWLDYRRCVVRNLTFPIIYWSRGFPAESWRYRLDCALAAYRELRGDELV